MQTCAELAGSHALRAGGSNQQWKGNSHFSLEKILSTKVSKYTTLHEMGFFSLDALQQAAYKWIWEVPWKRGLYFLNMVKLGVKQIAFKTSVSSEMTQLKLCCSWICCLLSSKKKSSFQILSFGCVTFLLAPYFSYAILHWNHFAQLNDSFIYGVAIVLRTL